MQINREPTAKHTIQSYTNTDITIANTLHQTSVVIHQHVIINDWPVRHITALSHDDLESIMALKPEIILIGHNDIGQFPPMSVCTYLSQHRIGLECMSIGAASRTFNVLLSEQRAVVLAIILSNTMHD